MKNPIRGGADLRARIRCCAKRLRLAAELALMAADGPEPRGGALYLVDALDDLNCAVRSLRRRRRPTP